jgi:hypothetical protein
MEAERHTDPIIEYYKQFVDRTKLRENLKLSVDERMVCLQELAAQMDRKAQPRHGPDRPWKPVSDCGPCRTTDPIIELYKQDVDRTLLRENLRRSTDQRYQALTNMALLVDELHR